MNSTPLAIETRGLGKRFGERAALDGIDLEVPRGTAFGFLGANGAGKTTLIRLLLGLAEPTAGTMRVLGHDIRSDRAVALARVGAIIEEPCFHRHLSGRENLRVNAAARDRAAAGRIDAALERVGLAGRADDKVGAYSLGMRQRLGVARCLLPAPELLILDEPMNGLDPAGILEFRGLIRSLVAEGTTVMLSSHLLDEVEKTCDYVAILDQGTVVAQGPIEELRGDGTPQVLIEVEDAQAARPLLESVEGVREVAVDEDGALRLSIDDLELVPDLNRRLVEAGLRVRRLEPVRASLEQRFLAITSRLEEVE